MVVMLVESVLLHLLPLPGCFLSLSDGEMSVVHPLLVDRPPLSLLALSTLPASPLRLPALPYVFCLAGFSLLAPLRPAVLLYVFRLAGMLDVPVLLDLLAPASDYIFHCSSNYSRPLPVATLSLLAPSALWLCFVTFGWLDCW